ncbi:MAG TPA: GNAT family N-acetyltransferase, partial [Tepidisphaeraceae bacterium]|nr:GNAT family N-acetyltransferase [Tepidisphaeraceae bacterium]
DIGARYLGWMEDPEVTRFLEVRFAGVKSVSELRDFVESVNESPANVLFGIFEKHSGTHIGNIKIGPIIREHARADIGYVIGERGSWGKGYASEAIKRVAKYAMEDLGLVKIKAGCYENNIGSAKALAKAGFAHEATVPSDCISDGRRVASLLFAMNK